MSNDSLPGGPIASRPVRFYFVVDCSGSMQGDKIQSLNQVIREAIPAMRSEAQKNPRAQLTVQAIKFADSASWHIASPTPLENLQWPDLQANGTTALGAALRMVADQLKSPPMPERALPPVICLVSDGQPTDDFKGGLDVLMQLPWGKKCVRVAIAIGQDADLEVLKQFVGNSELPVLVAKNADTLAKYIKWVTTTLTSSVTTPPSVPPQTGATPTGGAAPVPTPPPAVGPDVW